MQIQRTLFLTGVSDFNATDFPAGYFRRVVNNGRIVSHVFPLHSLVSFVSFFDSFDSCC